MFLPYGLCVIHLIWSVAYWVLTIGILKATLKKIKFLYFFDKTIDKSLHANSINAIWPPPILFLIYYRHQWVSKFSMSQWELHWPCQHVHLWVSTWLYRCQLWYRYVFFNIYVSLFIFHLSVCFVTNWRRFSPRNFQRPQPN